MSFDLSAVTTNALVIVPIVIAATQAIKLTGWIQDHFAPLVAIGIGIIIAWLADANNPNFSSILLSGGIYGLISSGLYSSTKTMMLARARQKAQQERQKRGETK